MNFDSMDDRQRSKWVDSIAEYGGIGASQFLEIGFYFRKHREELDAIYEVMYEQMAVNQGWPSKELDKAFRHHAGEVNTIIREYAAKRETNIKRWEAEAEANTDALVVA